MITISRSIRTERGMKMSVYASIGITGGAGLGLAYTPIVRGRSEADRECLFGVTVRIWILSYLACLFFTALPANKVGA